MATPPRKTTAHTSLDGNTTASVTVLHIGPKDKDLHTLEDIVRRTDFKMCPGTSWRLAESDNIGAAEELLQNHCVPIVVCGHDAVGGEWRDVLDRVGAFSTPPMLIVASRMADEYLWAEALNLGAYDVLSKPYSPAEAERVLSMAWLHWTHRPQHLQALATAC